MGNTQETTQVNIQVEFTIMQFKLQLLALAKDIVKDKLINNSIIEVYLDLREEVLGVPNPRVTKQFGDKV